MEIEPGEHGRRVGVGVELAALRALQVGVEDDRSVVDATSEHDPGVGMAVERDGGHGHRVRLRHAGSAGIGVPALPLRQRIGGDVGDVESRRLVLHPPRRELGLDGVAHGSMTSAPRMYGRRTSGMMTDPPGSRQFSRIAAQTRGTASAEPLSVWAISVPFCPVRR